VSGFSIRLYEPGDEVQILDLFNRVFSDDNPDFVPRDMATWRHIYERNPQGHKTLVGLDDQGRIVANYSSCPVAIRADGRPAVASQVVDSCVDKAWRRTLRKNSLFITIAMEYQRTFCDPSKALFNDYIYGLPNENHFPLGTRLLGYTPVHCPLPRQFRQLDADWLRGLEARAARSVSGTGTGTGTGTSGSRAGPLRVETVGWEALPALAALFEQHAGAMRLGLQRDAGYLAWRFRDWPGAPYRLALARRDGQPCGAAIYRIGVPWEHQPVAVVLDWFGAGDDEALAAALLSHVGGVGLAEGHVRLETWVTPAMPQRRTLLSLGMREEPTRFNLCMVLFTPRYDIGWVKQHWWLTMGDTDIY